MTREEMIEQLENTILLIKQNGKDWWDDRDIPVLEEAIKAMKAEQRIGKWEFLCHQNLKCSECGYVICDDDADEYKYCPNCGAKMEEGE